LDLYRVSEVTRKSEIKMLPSIGKPDVQAASNYVLPLLLEGMPNEQRDENSGNLSAIQQRSERGFHRCTTQGTTKTGS
ncbi:MAG: hypothetical protein AB2809_24685, partial [Candidatus Thiodiazotropha sp.]